MHIDTLGDPNAPKVWLFHGSAVPAESLSVLTASLTDTYHVYVPHFPGYQRTPYSTEDSLEGSLRTLAAHIEREGAPVVLVGHSFGLYRAIRLLELLEDGLALGLYGIGGVSTLPEEQREGFAQAEQWARAGEMIGQGLAARWFSPEYLERHEDVADTVEQWWSMCHIDAVARELFEPFDGGAADRIVAGSTLPITLRVGEQDAAVSEAQTRALASSRDGVTVETVEGAGHFLFLEDTEATIASVTEFVKACF